MNMYIRTVIILIYSITIVNGNFFTLSNIASYAKYIYPVNLTTSANGNELWTGILRDCSQKLSFSCVQKNAYSYLDDSLVEHDNITIFDGFILRKNKLNYDTCTKNCKDSDDLKDNIIESSKDEERSNQKNPDDYSYEEKKTPLEEITEALRDKTVKFLATRDYELELPKLFFDNSRIKISPCEIDENGALVRIDFGERGLESQGRLFKKIRKFIQNRLIMSFLALLLIVKLIKVKFAFIIPFLFGAAVSKKIFLKILLFLVPAFAHVFKLCSAYYSSHTKSHHHHHHQIAHHHHHVPVPVPVPTYIDHHHHSPPLPPPPHHEEEFEGYDYANPHLQIRKDMEELKEWGIDTFAESYEDPSLRPHPQGGPIPGSLPQGGPIGGHLPQSGPIPGHLPQSGQIGVHLPQTGPLGGSFPQPLPIGQPPNFSPNFDIPQFPAIQRPNLPFMDKYAPNIQSPAQSLAYNGYLDDQKLNRRSSVQINQQNQVKQSSPVNIGTSTIIKSNSQPVNPVFTQPASTIQTRQVIAKPSVSSIEQASNQVLYDDTFYGPILARLNDIFMELRFTEEACRERLVCSMYKNPERYSPHSNHVSNELSRNPQELKHGGNISQENKRFNQYVDAARVGQDGGDCLRSYPCHINTE